MRTKQLDLTGFLNLTVGVPYHGCHPAFGAFARSENIKKFEPGPAQRRSMLLPHPQVKSMFGPSVGVQRTIAFQPIHSILEPVLAAAVGSGRRSINQRQAKLSTNSPDFFGIIQIQAIKDFLIPQHGVGSGTQVKNLLNVGLVLVQPVGKSIPMDGLAKQSGFQTLGLGRVVPIVHQDQIPVSQPVEASGQVRSNKSSSSCYDYHCPKLSLCIFGRL